MKTFFTLVATGLLVVLVIQMAVEFRPEHMCVIRGLVVFLGGTFVFVVSVSGAMAGYFSYEDGWHSWCQHMYEKHPEKLNALVKHAGHSVDVFVRKYNNQKLKASDLPTLLILAAVSLTWQTIGKLMEIFY